MRPLALLAALIAVAADWPAFRGDGTGASPETNLPAGFSDTSGLRWKADLPGRGVSAVVTFGGTVYVTASSGKRDDRLHVLAFDEATGKPRWHRQLAATGSTAAHPDTCMAAMTPVADASGVYALFATGDLAAFTPDGTLRWYRSLVSDYPTLSNGTGMAASPVLAGGRPIVPMDNSGESFIAALDPATGQNVWKTPRPKGPTWLTPAVRQSAAGKTEVIFPGTEIAAYDAESGTKVWSAPGGGGIPSPTVASVLSC
jgi:outer membrane protein assembly factor BamB